MPKRECSANVWTKIVKLEDGENYEVCPFAQKFLSRALSGIVAALQEEGPALIVAHGGIHWAICYHMIIENHPWTIGNCEIVHFEPVEGCQWKASIIS